VTNALNVEDDNLKSCILQATGTPFLSVGFMGYLAQAGVLWAFSSTPTGKSLRSFPSASFTAAVSCLASRRLTFQLTRQTMARHITLPVHY
jgi:putative flippase GtrA